MQSDLENNPAAAFVVSSIPEAGTRTVEIYLPVEFC